MLNYSDVEKKVRSAPFIPFRIVTSSGKTYDVMHPELLLVGRRSLILGIPAHPLEKVYHNYDVISLLHVTALEDLKLSTSA